MAKQSGIRKVTTGSPAWKATLKDAVETCLRDMIACDRCNRVILNGYACDYCGNENPQGEPVNPLDWIAIKPEG